MVVIQDILKERLMYSLMLLRFKRNEKEDTKHTARAILSVQVLKVNPNCEHFDVAYGFQPLHWSMFLDE